MTKESFIKRVLLIMNEAGLIDSLGNSLLGADSAQVDRYIEGSFVDAWRRCVKVMPRTWFKNELFKNADIRPDLSGGTGCIVLPLDFYLLTTFKMNGWLKSIYESFLENERTSSIQANEYTRGSEIRPVCTISSKYIEYPVENPPNPSDPVSGIYQVLNYFSLRRGLEKHEMEEAIYVPVVKPLTEMEIDEDLGISDQVLEPLAYLSASTVFTMFEKYDISQALEQRAVEMFPGLQSVRGTNITVKQ
jgi:hypothetical protein